MSYISQNLFSISIMNFPGYLCWTIKTSFPRFHSTQKIWEHLRQRLCSSIESLFLSAPCALLLFLFLPAEDFVLFLHYSFLLSLRRTSVISFRKFFLLFLLELSILLVLWSPLHSLSCKLLSVLGIYSFLKLPLLLLSHSQLSSLHLLEIVGPLGVSMQFLSHHFGILCIQFCTGCSSLSLGLRCLSVGVDVDALLLCLPFDFSLFQIISSVHGNIRNLSTQSEGFLSRKSIRILPHERVLAFHLFYFYPRIIGNVL